MAAKTALSGCGLNAVVFAAQPKAEQIRLVNRNLRLAFSSRLAHKATGIISIKDNGIGREAAVAISKSQKRQRLKTDTGAIGNESDNSKVLKRYR